MIIGITIIIKETIFIVGDFCAGWLADSNISDGLPMPGLWAGRLTFVSAFCE
jgi:hypothetical protein